MPGLTQESILRPPRKPRVAILFERFGPYHVARLNAAAREVDLVGIEMTARDQTYAWDDTAGTERFERHAVCADDTEATLPHAALRLSRLLADAAPDAVAIPGWSHPLALAALAWCRRSGTTAILMSDSTANDAPRTVIAEAVKRWLVARFDTALVAGQPQRRYLEGLGMPAAAIRDGFDVVDNDHFARGADAARADVGRVRAERGLPASYFLACARFVPKKNIAGLLEAYAIYRHEAGDGAWHLVLVGDGPLRGALEAQIARLAIGDQVMLPGFRQYDEIPAYYGLAGAFVHASSVDQWGLVVNEAMAAGLPALVSSRCGCAPDLVVEGVTGHGFDPADPKGLAALMRATSGDPQSAAMGAAGRRHIAQWDLDRFARSLRTAAMARPSPRPRRQPFEGAMLRALSALRR